MGLTANLPSGWNLVSLYELAEKQKAKFDDGDWIEAEHITDRGVRLVQTGNIGIGRFVEKDIKKYIFQSSYEKLKCKQLHIGDLLICRLAEPAGRACVFPEIGEEKVVTSVDVTIFRPEAEKVDRRYLVQYLSTPAWFDAVIEQVGGTTHKRIARSALGNISIPLPPLRTKYL
jgi:type I restriction enzyme S subunit